MLNTILHIGNRHFIFLISWCSRILDTSTFVCANFGTIRNLVMTVKLGNIRPNYSEGFVAFTNRKSGVIENFSIKIEKELHAKSSIGTFL